MCDRVKRQIIISWYNGNILLYLQTKTNKLYMTECYSRKLIELDSYI